mgnify:CR=1 FL=1
MNAATLRLAAIPRTGLIADAVLILGGALGNVMIIGKGLRGPNPGDVSIATFGAQFAEVEVDIETGIVRVLRLVAAHDAGRIVNPTLAESQLEGGIIQGLGYAVFEERVLDGARGVTLNPNLHDYRIPAMLDVPAIGNGISTLRARERYCPVSELRFAAIFCGAPSATIVPPL